MPSNWRRDKKKVSSFFIIRKKKDSFIHDTFLLNSKKVWGRKKRVFVNCHCLFPHWFYFILCCVHLRTHTTWIWKRPTHISMSFYWWSHCAVRFSFFTVEELVFFCLVLEGRNSFSHPPPHRFLFWHPRTVDYPWHSYTSALLVFLVYFYCVISWNCRDEKPMTTIRFTHFVCNLVWAVAAPVSNHYHRQLDVETKVIKVFQSALHQVCETLWFFIDKREKDE